MVLEKAFKAMLLLIGLILALSISPVPGNPSLAHQEAAARHHEPGHEGDLSDLEVAPRHHHPEHDHPSEEKEGETEDNDSGTSDMVMTNNKQLDDQDPMHHD